MFNLGTLTADNYRHLLSQKLAKEILCRATLKIIKMSKNRKASIIEI